jgi:hypothetical protein
MPAGWRAGGQAGEGIEIIWASLFLEVSERIRKIWNEYTVSGGKWSLFLCVSTLSLL